MVNGRRRMSGEDGSLSILLSFSSISLNPSLPLFSLSFSLPLSISFRVQFQDGNVVVAENGIEGDDVEGNNSYKFRVELGFRFLWYN